MGRGADAHAFGDGVGDVEHLAHRFGQQVARNAGEDDDGTGQGGNAAQLSGHIHADGSGHGFGQQGGVLLFGQVQRQGKSKGTAQADQCANRDAGDDGGGVLPEQVPLFIQRDGQGHGGRQQQVVHRGGAGLVVGVGNLAHRQEDDDKDAAQQQGIEDGFAGDPVDQGTQCKGCQREQHAPRRRPGQEIIQHGLPPSFCGRSWPGWCGLRRP